MLCCKIVYLGPVFCCFVCDVTRTCKCHCPAVLAVSHENVFLFQNLSSWILPVACDVKESVEILLKKQYIAFSGYICRHTICSENKVNAVLFSFEKMGSVTAEKEEIFVLIFVPHMHLEISTRTANCRRG